MSTQTQRAAERRRNHEKAIKRYYEWLERPRESHGLTHLKSRPRSRNRVPFESLPPEWRPAAQAELTRLIEKHTKLKGMPPSQQLVAILHGAAARTVRCHRIPESAERWMKKHRADQCRAQTYRRFQARLGRERNSDIRTVQGTEPLPPHYIADPPRVIPFRRRSNWSLRGI